MKNKVVLHPKNLFFEKEVQLKFRLCLDEFKESVASLLPKRIRFMYYAIPVFGFIRYFIPVIQNNFVVFSWSYFLSHIIDVIFIFSPFIKYIVFNLIFNKISSAEKNNYIFSKDIVIISSKNYKTEISLNAINKVVITKNLILFSFTEFAINNIPKRAFTSTEELNYFIEKLKSYSN